MTAAKINLMQTPPTFSNPLLQAGAAVICWILAFHLPSKAILSVPIIDGLDIALTIALKLLGGAATLTTIGSFYIKNEARLKRWWRKLRSKR